MYENIKSFLLLESKVAIGVLLFLLLILYCLHLYQKRNGIGTHRKFRLDSRHAVALLIAFQAQNK